MVATIEALSRRSPPLDLVIGLDVPEPRWLNRASRESAIEVKRSGEACRGRQWRPSLVVQLHSCSHACLRAYSCELHFVVMTVPHVLLRAVLSGSIQLDLVGRTVGLRIERQSKIQQAQAALGC